MRGLVSDQGSEMMSYSTKTLNWLERAPNFVTSQYHSLTYIYIYCFVGFEAPGLGPHALRVRREWES